MNDHDDNHDRGSIIKETIHIPLEIRFAGIVGGCITTDGHREIKQNGDVGREVGAMIHTGKGFVIFQGLCLKRISKYSL